MKASTRSMLVIVFLLLLVGCTQVPLQNVVDAPLGSGSTSLENVSKAIARAGDGFGWTIEDVSPGAVKGTLNLRKHTANVSIVYDTQKFSITYTGSRNLDYDEGRIHRSYNHWVKNLKLAIQRETGLSPAS